MARGSKNRALLCITLAEIGSTPRIEVSGGGANHCENESVARVHLCKIPVQRWEGSSGSGLQLTVKRFSTLELRYPAGGWHTGCLTRRQSDHTFVGSATSPLTLSEER